MFSVSAATEHYYKIGLEYNNGEVTYNSLSVIPATEEMQPTSGTFIAELISVDNKILNLTFFEIPLIIFYDSIDPQTGEINGGGMKELNQSETTLYVPYYENAQEINIYNWSLTKLLTIPVNDLSKGKAAKEVIRDETTTEEEDIPEAETAAAETTTTTIKKVGLGVGAGLAIFALLVLIIILIKRKKPNPNQSLHN